MRITTIALGILLLFALVGALVSSVVLHEFSHYQDLKSIEKQSEELCLLAYPGNGVLGYYSFEATGQDDQIENIGKYTEFKAYGVTIFIMIILFGSLGVSFVRFYEMNMIEKQEIKYLNELKRIISVTSER